MNVIKFPAVVYKVQTLSDNGIRVSLDLSEDCTMQLAQLAECQRFGIVLDCCLSASISKGDYGNTGKLEKGSKRKSTWQTPEEATTNSGT